MLARNSDVDEVIRSMKRLEDKFNRKFDYPWVFLNDQPFNAEFKKYVNGFDGSILLMDDLQADEGSYELKSFVCYHSS